MIEISLIAANSSGTQRLSFSIDPDEGCIDPCLRGELNGEVIQIDFEPVDITDLQEIVVFLERQINRVKEKAK